MTTPTASRTDTEEPDMTTTAPSPEAFLAAPPDPDEDDEETPETEPVEHLAQESLRSFPSGPLESIATSLGQIAAALTHQQVATANDDLTRQEIAALEQENRELEDLHTRKSALIEEVLALIKPSTSKLSNQVRALLEPPVAPTPEVKPEPEAPPAHDAPLEDWLAYAQARGLEVDPGRTNRSQIRTALGIPQPTSEQGEEVSQ